MLKILVLNLEKLHNKVDYHKDRLCVGFEGKLEALLFLSFFSCRYNTIFPHGHTQAVREAHNTTKSISHCVLYKGGSQGRGQYCVLFTIKAFFYIFFNLAQTTWYLSERLRQPLAFSWRPRWLEGQDSTLVTRSSRRGPRPPIYKPALHSLNPKPCPGTQAGVEQGRPRVETFEWDV